MTTAEYIPFINGPSDCEIAARLYSDAATIRISLDSIQKMGASLPSGPKRWLDPAIDGLHHKNLSKLRDDYKDHIKKFPGYERVADLQFQQNPDKAVVEQFVFSVLDSCNALKPDWISVPQLPLVNNVARNKINKLMAEQTKLWKLKRSYVGRLILPAIFTHQNQLNKKAERDKKILSIAKCFASAGADGVWAVDSSLKDQEGSGTFDERFLALRKFHEELNLVLSDDAITICGPYWGMNLVLWSRGSVRSPAIGLGSSYNYNIPGLKLQKGKKRVALRPLRRWAIASPQLRDWLRDAVASLSPGDPVITEFAAIEKDFSKLQIPANGRIQIAAFYKEWFDKFSTLPQAGRALALYQDLSSAYVLGKTLKSLPAKEGAARKPERVAQQLMLNCL